MKSAADKSEVAIRPLLQGDAESLLRAILAAGDSGVLLTNLDHQSLACNRQFGEIFNVVPAEVVRFSVRDLREKVLPLIPDPDEWVRRLDEIYADPYCYYEDDLTLQCRPPIVVHRYTGPVTDGNGELIGRIWTFRDVTSRIRSERMGIALHEVSAFHDPDPAVVNRRVLETIAEFYGTNAILSIRDGDYLEFRDIVGPSPLLAQLRGSELPNSYCRWVFEAKTPVRILDGRLEPDRAPKFAVRAGFTRYLGAPVFDAVGTPIGTICLLDGKSDEPLDEEDARFMALLAMRVGAELARERFIRQRIAAQEETMRQQREDLAATHEVLTAMNLNLELLSAPSFDDLLHGQLSGLFGLLGYRSSALVLCEPGGARLIARREPDGDAFEEALSKADGEALRRGFPKKAAGAGELRAFSKAESRIGGMLGNRFLAVAPLSADGQLEGFLVLGRDAPPPLEDRHHRTHLEALAEQVDLVLAAFLLHRRLTETSEELRDTRRQLILNEKLSAIGTLAAATAHDIRNILASLSFEMADRGDPSRSLQAVEDQLDRFKVLAHRLLSYARPQMMAHGPVDLDRVIENVIGLTDAHAKLARVRITFRSAGGLPRVTGEAHQLEHLFVNLVLNAIQAMEPGGGTLEIMASRRGVDAEVRLQDTGRGIAEPDRATLFQPFKTGRAEGFGLGLYSCRRIVEEHGGIIEVESKVGKGTTFVIRLRGLQSQEEGVGRKAAAHRR